MCYARANDSPKKHPRKKYALLPQRMFLSHFILLLFAMDWKKINSSQGKIGDLRWQDEKTGLYEVHFEDKDLKPYLVKESNINILFELLNE